MCVAIALARSELPDAVVGGLGARVHTRGGEPEVRFYWRAVPSLIPVWWDGRLHVVKWGNRDRSERQLPPTGWTWRATVEAGRWAGMAPEPVEIPASFAFMNGVWFKVTQGVRGLLVRDRGGEPVVFMVCEPASRFYRIMTRSEWAPRLINQVI